jgi:hypothetical protein
MILEILLIVSIIANLRAFFLLGQLHQKKQYKPKYQSCKKEVVKKVDEEHMRFLDENKISNKDK